MSCQYKYKDPKRKCNSQCVKGDILCRRHRWLIKKNPSDYNILKSNGKLRRSQADKDTCNDNDKEEDAQSQTGTLCTIQEEHETVSEGYSIASNYSVDDTSINNDNIEITKRFVFKCMDQYFEEHNKRNDLLKDFGGGKKKSSSSFDMNTILGIGGVSLLPLLTKFLNNQNNQNNNISNNNNASNRQEDFIRMDRPKRPENYENFIERDNNTEEVNFTKV